MAEPPVAERVMVYAPAGVPLGLGCGPMEPPLQLTVSVETKRSRVKITAIAPRGRLLGSAKVSITPRRPAPRSVAKSKPARDAAAGCTIAAKVRDVVVIVSMVVAGERPGVTDDWLKLHAAPVGWPEQAKLPTGAL